MTRPLDRHLDCDELDALVASQSPSVTSTGPFPTQKVEEARRHVASCQDCERKVRMHKFVQSEISQPRTLGGVSRSPECIDTSEWVRVAAGLLPENKTRELMNHAARCGHCGPLLRTATDTLSDDATREEETLVANLKTAQPQWQSRMAETLRSGVKPRQTKDRSPSWFAHLLDWPRPVFALAAVAVAIVAGWQGTRLLRPPSADQLLAQAYTQRRTLEVRISGAKFAPMRAERGPGGSNLDKPAPLLKAEDLIEENLQQHPKDPAWLQAKARADLLDGNYESAIKTLEQALETQPDSPSLLTDLASGYFVRAEATDRPIDFGNAIESLGKALAKSPDDPVALFNRALACEKVYLFSQAVDDWQHYLRVDSNGEWADEARKHLQAVQDKLKKHAALLAEPLLTPVQIAKAGPDDTAVQEKIDERIEDYVNVAVEEWLPQADSEKAQGSADDFQKALWAVADISTQKHGDQWLKDVLMSRTHLPLGVQALGTSVQMNQSAEYGAAEKAALAAETYFAGPGEQPLLVRARLEHLFAVNRRFEGTHCHGIADRIEQSIANRPYIWIQGQLLIERINCSGANGNTRANHTHALAAARLAEEHSYNYLRLRCLAAVAESDANPARSFATDLEGLRLYWAEITNPSRAYQFLAAMAILAEGRNRWKFATALNREAVVAIAAANRPAIEAGARSWFGRAAYQAGYRDLASLEWKRSREMFRSIPADAAVKSALAALAVDLAKVDLDNENLEDAAAELRDAAPRFSEPGLHRLSIDYYATLGRLHEHNGQRGTAEKAFREAASRSEEEVSSTKSIFERVRLSNICAACYRAIARLRLENEDAIGAQAIWQHYQNLPVQLEQIKTSVAPSVKLPPDTVLYSLVDLDNRIVVWLTTGSGTHFRELKVSRAELRYTAERFAAECSDSESSLEKLRSDGRKLYDWLLAPLIEQVDPAHILIIEADPSLPLIPFEALVDERGYYIAESHAVAYTIGTAFLQQSPPNPTRLFAGRALVVASPMPAAGSSSQIVPLSESVREAHDVAARFSSSMFLEGSEAKISEVKRELNGVSVFHYAGHASATPGRTGLLLAQDVDADDLQSSALTPDQIAVSALRNLDLVVLSACSTAQLPEEDSSDIAGLSQDFLLAGSKVVLGNKWAADSSAAELLIHLFYDGLLSGNSAAVALNQAQAQLRGQQRFQHPFFWSTASIWI